MQDIAKKQKFVVKVGNASLNTGVVNNLLTGLNEILKAGIDIIIVHGGGESISEEMKKLGKKPVWKNGLRYTDKETLGIVCSVLKKLNSKILEYLEKNGLQCIGFCGDGVVTANKTKEALGYVGEVNKIDVEKIGNAINNGKIPVIAPLGKSKEGLYNINADIVAAHVASALQADKLIFVTDVEGIYQKNQLVGKVSFDDAKKIKCNGGMLPKLNAALFGIGNGVPVVHITNCNQKLSTKIFLEEGTIIYGYKKN